MPSGETVAKNIRIPASLETRLREEAFSSRRSQNEILVRALESYLEALSRRRAKANP